MRKLKVLCLLLTVIMCCTFLSGCFGGVSDITINDNGSVDVVARAGYTREYNDSFSDSTDYEEIFTYDGIEYYGNVEEQYYNTLEEFTNVWGYLLETVDYKTLNVEKVNEDFILSIDAEGIGTLIKETKAFYSGNEDFENLDEKEKARTQKLIDETTYVLNFKFPKELYQISGSKQGVKIDGKNLTLNIKEMDGITEDIVITTEVLKNENVMILQTFDDVEYGTWYFNAVQGMAVGGLVTGVGNDMFNPMGTLTYAEFCQILSRAKGLKTGSKNGYWGYEAINSCIENGYIENLGIIVSKNYDKPITREAAVAGMFRAKAKDLYAENKVGNKIKESNIPDYKKIDEEYRRDVLNAYNSGITQGVDIKYTFNPKGLLTRAEVCQLFFNMNWTRPAK